MSRATFCRWTFLNARSTRSQRTTVAPHWQRSWNAGGVRRYRVVNHQRILASWNALRQWIRDPMFPYHIAGMGLFGGMLYLYFLERAPISERLRFNMISPHWTRQLGNAWFQREVEKNSGKILSESTAEHARVQRVFKRLIANSGLTHESWEVTVIDDPEISAFVLPGGKVFVYRGMLDLCTRDDELAVVLGHEIAHNIVGHGSERLSRQIVLIPFVLVGWLASGMDEDLVQLAVDIAFRLPHERFHEIEADNLGLQIMAESCYDPSAALDLWSRWGRLQSYDAPWFMTTHPSHHSRLNQFYQWLKEVRDKRLSQSSRDNDFSIAYCLQREFCGVERPPDTPEMSKATEYRNKQAWAHVPRRLLISWDNPEMFPSSHTTSDVYEKLSTAGTLHS